MPCLRPNSLFKKKLRILGETNYKLHRKLLKNSSLLNVKFCPEEECFYNNKVAVLSNINNQELKSEINFVIQSNTQYKHTKTLPACPGFTSLRSYDILVLDIDKGYTFCLSLPYKYQEESVRARTEKGGRFLLLLLQLKILQSQTG